MSHDATNWAIKAAKGIGLSANSKLVLWHLADSFNPTYGCFQQQSYIAGECEISRATLNRCLDELEAKQLIARERRVDRASGQQLSTRYRLACEKDFVPQDVVSRVSNPDTAAALAERGKAGEDDVENPVSHEADRVSKGPVAVSHSSETLTSKEPLNPLPPSGVVAEAPRATQGTEIGDDAGADFAALLREWPDNDATDTTRAVRAFAGLDAEHQRKAVALAHDFRRGCYRLGRQVPRLSSYLRARLYLEFDNPPPIEDGHFKIVKGSDEFAAWRAHYKTASPTVFVGMGKQGFLLVATRWPPVVGALSRFADTGDID